MSAAAHSGFSEQIFGEEQSYEPDPVFLPKVVCTHPKSVVRTQEYPCTSSILLKLDTLSLTLSTYIVKIFQSILMISQLLMLADNQYCTLLLVFEFLPLSRAIPKSIKKIGSSYRQS